MNRIVFAGLAAMVATTSPVLADGDAASGKKVFVKCMACHENEKGVNKIGPTLKGVVGRKAASVADFKYSEAMLAKGAEGVIWDEATLTAYLPDPRAFVPKTKMTFPGLKKPKEIADIIAFLKSKP